MSRASNPPVTEAAIPIAGPGICGDPAEPDPAAGCAADIVAEPCAIGKRGGGGAAIHGIHGSAGPTYGLVGGGILADAAAVLGPTVGVAADAAAPLAEPA